MEKSKIIVVDDENSVRSSLRRVLRAPDFEFLEASSGEQALGVFKENDIAVAIVDQMMPGIKGTELLKWIKRNSPDTVRVMLTAVPSGDVAQDAINKGEVFKFLAKPWEDVELRRTLRECVDHHRRLRQLHKDARNVKNNDELYKIMMKRVRQSMQEIKARDAREKAQKVAILMSLAEAVEARDPYTQGHQLRVAETALDIGAQLGLKPAQLESLRVAGLVHDIGKVAISDEILFHNGVLNPEMWRRIKLHPTIGGKILDPVDSDWNLKTIVEQHHERYDGMGYPRGLRGREICFQARILNIADAYDAMNSDRPYRKALPLRSVVRELERNRGRQFDPLMTDIMVEKLKKGEPSTELSVGAT